MRNYHIYLLKEDVAYDYFGKERLIFNLFVEKLAATHVEHINLLEKQINYITRPISVLDLNRFIEKNVSAMVSFDKDSFHCSFFLQSKNTNSSAKLIINNRFINLIADGTFEAETTCFEILRKYNSCFLAMDFGNYHYGWLNPLKQKRYV